MVKKPERKCPKCGGIARLHKNNGVETTYYCECDDCHLRARDCKSMYEAVKSWETDEEQYFFYRKS